MRILVIDNAAINSQFGKYCVYRATGEFANELQNLGNEVEFFQIYRKSEDSLNSYFPQDHIIKISVAKAYKGKIFTYIFAYIKGINRIIHNDFVYLFYPNAFKYLVLFTKLFGKRYGVYLRGEIGISSRVSNIIFKNADAILTVSQTFTKSVNNRLLVEKAKTIRPMVSFTCRDIISNRIYNKTNSFNILFLGRIEREKGVFELLKAIKEIKENSTIVFNLFFIGNGTDLPLLKIKANELNTLSYVNFLGSIEDMDEIKSKYIQADIYVLPSYHEGFPRTLYEAMIFSTPIVTTLVGGISSLMRDNYNCYKIEPKSPESIVDKLIYVMTHYSEVTEVVENGRTTVASIINPSRPSHALLLNQVINNL